MFEIWVDIPNFEKLYQVSNLGRVKSIYRYKKTLKPCIDKDGYYYVKLYKCKKQTHQLIHRLVAKSFIPNPDNLPQINHKDEDKTNNCVDNLEWCSNLYNINYGNGKIKSAESRSLKVEQYSIDGVFIKRYKSLSSASKENNIPVANICKCCKGERTQAGNYIWKYTLKN